MRAALGFPAVLFSFALLVVAGYWLVVLIGGADGVDAFDGGDGVHADVAGLVSLIDAVRSFTKRDDH
ncbi:hypothetical protein AB4212_52960 [Streptomyces sp. 2MCAF27]